MIICLLYLGQKCGNLQHIVTSMEQLRQNFWQKADEPGELPPLFRSLHLFCVLVSQIKLKIVWTNCVTLHLACYFACYLVTLGIQ